MSDRSTLPEMRATQAEGRETTNDVGIEKLARQLAAAHSAVRQPGDKPSLTDDLEGYRRLFREANRYFMGASEQELSISYAAEWMLDNYHVVLQALRQIGEDMPVKYYHQLPKLTGGPLQGYPRVYALAFEIIMFSKGEIDLDAVRRFVQAYQTVTALTMGEVWALPVMLRLGVVQSLALAVSELTGVGIEQYGRMLRVIDLTGESSADAVVANSFISLRTLGAEDWKDFFENLSLVELILTRDPSGHYSNMDFNTRDHYRKVIEEIALEAGQNELEVAREAVRLAQVELDRSLRRDGGRLAAPAEEKAAVGAAAFPWRRAGQANWGGFEPARTSHVGFYLLDKGRTLLESSLAYRLAWDKRISRWILAHPAMVYLGSISLLSLALVALLAMYAGRAGGTPGHMLAAALLGSIPAMTVVVHLVNWMITNTVEPRVLPKMDFKDGVPENCRSMVVVPALLANEDEVKSLLKQLELHYLRNSDVHLSYALLTDFADAPHQNMPEDEGLIRQAVEGVMALNEKHGWGTGGPFYLFHRERRWNPGEERWIGWERKRGKLHEFNNLILAARRVHSDGHRAAPGRPVNTSYTVQIGNLGILAEIRYVITLDADTILPRDSAQRLVAALAHPLNQAEFAENGPHKGKIIAGYSILQPRTEINPTSANQTRFTRIFSGDTGLDLYTLAVSDIYQDFFGEGIYVGKGIYDVEAFERGLAGRVPENTLLSHDLFEGIHGRVGLVTDIVLIEDYPPHYLLHVQRLHRWVRGDWQLLPWVFRRVPSAGGRKIPNRFSAIDWWKIVDNLRRSLVSPVLLLFFIAGWFWLPGSPVFWTAAGMLVFGVPLLTDLAGSLIQFFRAQASRITLDSIRNSAMRQLLALAFLPYEAQLDLDAVFTTLVRLYITRKQMLRWTTAAQAAKRMEEGIHLQITHRQMIGPVLLGFIAGLLLLLANPQALPVALPLLATWLLSPEIAYWISQPVRKIITPLDEAQRQQLHSLARRTWLFFEQFVGPEDHWLPPDHFQEEPLGVVAHRTSPTNIGLGLVSTLAAYDLGYIGALDLAGRLRTSFENLEKLERHRGHFLNWYDTRNLEPLQPRYISTVDSGNLAASLFTLSQGCMAMPHAAVLRWESWQGLLDTFALLSELIEILGATGAKPDVTGLEGFVDQVCQKVLSLREQPEDWVPLLKRLSTELWVEFDRQLVELVETSGNLMGPENLRRLRIYNQRLRYQLDSALREVELLLPWLLFMSRGLENQPPELLTRAEIGSPLHQAWQSLLETLPMTPKMGEIGEVAGAGRERLAELLFLLDEASQPTVQVEAARSWCAGLDKSLESARMGAKVLQIGYEDLQRQAEAYIQEMDFRFLFDAERQVFHIGYNLSLERLDNNYYDLLASEARIASLIAIANGGIPQSHWLHLSRPLTQVDSTQALLSWSGTMFEYLMPQLFVRNYEGTLLHQSSYAAVERHIAYGEEKKIPWGISESGYYRFDANMAYQYRAFGVPGLGYKRGLGDDLVVSPYASLLALPIRPQAVMKNITELVRHKMMGTFGLYEAIDFTPGRLTLGNRYQIVQEYMAHHQGMILLSLVNILKDNVMVERFHADARIQTVELLLQEQIPENAPIEQPHLEEGRVIRPEEAIVTSTPWRLRVQVPQPRAHVLSNGRYSLVITNSGGGYSSWRDIDLTRWRADTTLNNWGTWIYMQDRERAGQESGSLWSASYQPSGVSPQSREVYFSAHMAEFLRQDGNISSLLEITVSPDDDLEIRRITLTNHGDVRRRLRLTSYGEVSLTDQATDRRHPAFNKLFIESEYLPEINTLIYRRRPRSSEEEPIYMAHTLVVEQGHPASRAYEGDRARFLGRGRSARRPAALIEGGGLSGTVGATLDPIFSLAQHVDLEPHDSVQLAFMTIAAGTRQQAIALAGRYHSWHLIERAFDQARSQSEVELRQLGLNTPQLERIERVLSALLFVNPFFRARPDILSANDKGQPGLWAYGISGDFPILLLRLKSQDDLSLAQELLQAHIFWRNRRIKVDLVFLNKQGTDYGQELNSALHRLITRMNSDAWLNLRGGIFLLLADQMGETERILLETAARVILDGENGSLAEQIRGMDRLPTRLPRFVATLPEVAGIEPTPPVRRRVDLIFDNGYGGFSPDGREYVVYLGHGQWTPAPWVNVIANPEFGFLVSEAGSSFTWSINSGENRLTPWSNDPVTDPPGEALYLRDEETAEVWSPTPLPARDPAPYLIRHGAGYSIFEHYSHGLKQRVRMFTIPNAPVKVVQVRLENIWKRSRRITATFYAEWVLGVNREMTQQFVVPEYDGESQALLARNTYNIEFGERVAFAAANKTLHGLTADRTEFFGRMGDYAFPSALKRIGLSSTVEPGLDPCAALQLHIDLQPGDVEEVYFLLGQGANQAEALQLVRQYKNAHEVAAAWDAVGKFWDDLLETVRVKTPEPAMDLLLNRWLLYQALACRIWGRSAFYQSSGAYGFRDQLQDVMATIFSAPEVSREHLLRAAAHQFEAGDVLHWWHPPSGRGVRTRFSDDLLWLPFVTAHYVLATGDESVLNENVPFMKGPLLDPEEEERYGFYQTSAEAYSLYEHCRRALEKGTTSGPHNLPLMGSGDWNDGMNRVGVGGRGESVWLGWFLIATLNNFAELCDRRGDEELAALYRQRAALLSQAIEANAWDGQWYLRAFYDDGTPLGSSKNDECQIDAIAQSWTVLSGAGDPQRAEQAMHSVSERLVRYQDGIILLFTPPFDKTPRDPGYIKGYLPGIRENGGQYTHAALWTIWAYTRLGQGNYAEELFRLINPIYHSDDPQKADLYKVEPYVIAADVYGAPPHTGRGGWTWYTGSSGWMYRLGLEAILGVYRVGQTLVVDPCIPPGWPGFEVILREGGSCYKIIVDNSEGVNRGVRQVKLDGEILTDGKILLKDDAKLHRVEVRMG